MKGAYNNRSDNTKIQTMRMRIGASTHTKKENKNRCFGSQISECEHVFRLTKTRMRTCVLTQEKSIIVLLTYL